MPGQLTQQERDTVQNAITAHAVGERKAWCNEVLAYLGQFKWAGSIPDWESDATENLAMNCWCAPIYIAYKNKRLKKKTVDDFKLMAFQYPELSSLAASQRAAHEFLKGALAGGDEGVPGDLQLFYLDSMAGLTDPSIPEIQRQKLAAVPLGQCPVHVAVNMGPNMSVSLWTVPNDYDKYQYCPTRELKTAIERDRRTTCTIRSVEPFWIVGKKTKSLCYITTATCRAQGLPDDCAELTTLRRFRDEVVRATPEGARQVAEYYATAPGIVARIDRRDDAEAIYAAIHRTYIRPSVDAVERGEFARAQALFETMVRRLEAEHGG